METIKAKHTVGDDVHVKLFYAEDRVSMKFYGRILAARKHTGSLFPDQIHYDVELEQTEAPPILISNLPKGFVLAGGPEREDAIGAPPIILSRIPWVSVLSKPLPDNKAVPGRHKEEGGEYEYESLTREGTRIFIREEKVFDSKSEQLNGWEWLDESGRPD